MIIFNTECKVDTLLSTIISTLNEAVFEKFCMVDIFLEKIAQYSLRDARIRCSPAR